MLSRFLPGSHTFTVKRTIRPQDPGDKKSRPNPRAESWIGAAVCTGGPRSPYSGTAGLFSDTARIRDLCPAGAGGGSGRPRVPIPHRTRDFRPLQPRHSVHPAAGAERIPTEMTLFIPEGVSSGRRKAAAAETITQLLKGQQVDQLVPRHGGELLRWSEQHFLPHFYPIFLEANARGGCNLYIYYDR